MNAIPYLILGFFLYFLYLNENRKITIISVKNARRVAFVTLLIFIGLRGHIYSDFISYCPFFENLPNLFNLTQTSFTEWYFEPGFILYSSIIKTIVPNYFGWVFINTLIDLLVFNYLFKHYTSSRILPYIFFMAFNGFIIEFNLYRNVKAIDLFLLSLPYLQTRKCLPYMILNILGTTFHLSSVIYLPLYFILYINIPKFIKWGGIIVANLVFLGQVHIISDIINSLGIFQAVDAMDKLTGYVENSDNSYGISFGYIERTLGVVLFTILYDKLCQAKSINIIFYNCFWLYYITFLCFYEVSVLTERIPILFMFSYWVLYPNAITIKSKYRRFIYAVSILLAFVKIYSSNTNVPAKYENILFGIEDYNHRKQAYESYVDNFL